MSEQKQQALVQVRDLLIEFGTGRKKFKAVKGVTFDVNKGETFGLVGESGSGKTTVARAIMGMQPIADGAVYFDGKLSRGKQPNLYRLSKALERNLGVLVENQTSTTIKMNEYISEYKRIYFKYLDSKYYVIETGELIAYKDGVDRRIKEGVNLKDTKIVTSDKENHLKQLSLLVNDSLKRLVKLLRILQKTIQFTNQLSEFIDLDPKIDQTITKYLNTSKKKLIEIKEYENQVYFALKGSRQIRRDVLAGKYTSISQFFGELGELIKTMITNHKQISNIVKSINKDIKFVQALVSPKKDRPSYVQELLTTMDTLRETVALEDQDIIKEYEEILYLLSLKNINEAIEESALFAKTTKQAKKQLKREMQMIFQDPASSLNDRMAVEEIIGEGLNNFSELYKNDQVVDEYVEWYNADKPAEEHISRKNVTNKQVKHYLILQQLESVGLLPEHLSRYPHEFSGGQRQRIGIARSLIMKPKFIVADEPISALDVSIRAQVLNLLNKFQKEYNLTYIFIAHDLSVVRHIADRIAVIYRGDIVELAEAEELFNNPLHPYTKSLLTAIPLADPEQEAKKIHLTYDPEVEHPDYLSDFPFWQEVTPNHFVYANQREFKQYEETLQNKPETKKSSVKKTTTKKVAAKSTSNSKSKSTVASKKESAVKKTTTKKATVKKDITVKSKSSDDSTIYIEAPVAEIITHDVEKKSMKKKGGNN